MKHKQPLSAKSRADEMDQATIEYCCTTVVLILTIGSVWSQMHSAEAGRYWKATQKQSLRNTAHRSPPKDTVLCQNRSIDHNQQEESAIIIDPSIPRSKQIASCVDWLLIEGPHLQVVQSAFGCKYNNDPSTEFRDTQSKQMPGMEEAVGWQLCYCWKGGWILSTWMNLWINLKTVCQSVCICQHQCV